MKTPSVDYQPIYQLLQNVLSDAFQLQAIYFTPPYKDTHTIDLGIRASVWTNYLDQDSFIHFSSSEQPYRILIIKSNLGFFNVLVVLGSTANPDFITIGPFRNDKLSPNYFTQILKDAHIPPTTIQKIRHLYESMPFVQLDAVVNVTKDIFEAFIPEFKEIQPEFMQYTEQKREINIDTDMIEKNLLISSETYHKLLFNFLKTLVTGDTASSQKALHAFLQKNEISNSKNMRDYKALLQSLNHYCHIALLQTGIHPSHIIKQSFSIENKIDSTTSQERLEQMPNEICHKYCLLVKNFSNPGYSKLTKDVIAYIQLHMEEELTLNRLAEHFSKNASVLSNLFSKETGVPLTKFIQQTRIQEALLLFNTTVMSVSEVAVAVGYQDFSYFSKIFTKIVGCSPRDYKRQLKKQ